MYLSHFGLNEPPFRITPNTEFFFEGANRGATLEALLYAIHHDEGIIKVSGEVGSGKTMLCRVLLERLPETVETIYLATPSLSRDEILKALCEDLKINIRGKRTTLLLRALQDHLIERYATSKRVVVLIDEAHAMPPETLEEIRLLSNLESNRHKLLQIVLFGQPELEDHLNSPNMRQLKERITHSFRLEPMVRSDIDSYVDFRMRAAGYRGRNAFSPEALKLIAKTSEGLTRRINILSDKGLLAAFADSSHEVTAKHAKAAIDDSDFDPMVRKRRFAPRWVLATMSAAGGLVLGLAIAYAALWKPTPDQSRKIAPAAAPVNVAKPAPLPVLSPPPALLEIQPGVPSVGIQPAGAPPTVVPPPIVPPPIASATPPPVPPAAATTTTLAAISTEAAARAPRNESLARERYLLTQAWLQAAPPAMYSAQLLTAADTDLPWVENYLQRASEALGSDQLYVYSVRLNGRQGYRVAYGAYGNAQEAFDAIGRLPAPLKTFKPYPESVEMMRRTNAFE